MIASWVGYAAAALALGLLAGGPARMVDAVVAGLVVRGRAVLGAVHEAR